jgi:crotonobetainyl-CoA:carnitine CoA-transferase CaiB-like acyl-CoA transferase
MTNEAVSDAQMLEGIRVVEFAALIAGPSCARFLADHGAEVIKIERYPGGDISRHSFNTHAPGRGPMFMQHNAGKKSMCVDLKSDAGKAVALDLIAQSDIVIEAFTPGVMERLGLGYEALKRINPGIILCSVSGFGQTGPNATKPGYAHVAHATSGWLGLQFLHRDPPEAPRGPGIAIGDTTTGLTAFGAVCAALFARERTGEGKHVDIALFDSLFCSNDFSYQHALQYDGEVEAWYHPVHATVDGYVTAAVGPDFRAWANVCKAMGNEALLEDPRFDNQEHVMAHKNEAAAVVSAWLSALTCAEAVETLNAHHVPCAKVLTVPEAVVQPQVTERGLTSEIEDPIIGSTKTMNSAFRYLDVDTSVRRPAPMLGEHNKEVLEDVLGYSAEQIAALEARGVLASRDR